MEEIAISKFKATCLAVLEKVRKTGQPILVTRFGQPMVQIVPPEGTKRVRRFGTGVGSITILGDIVGPIGDISDWEAARDHDEEEK
jgi:prevent-host-death family protein